MKWTIGIDEVGRGPLAGPLTIAAVAMRNTKRQCSMLDGIKDSKKLSEKQRLEWCQKLCLDDVRRNKNTHVIFPSAISSVAPHTIDRIGMTRATKRAVGSCLKKLSRIHNIDEHGMYIMLDGSLYAPDKYENQETIIKGDEKIPIIAAASIVAKIHRDNTMRRLHKKFPQYQFNRHKGYGTKLHFSLIKQHGLSEAHRASFCSKII